MPWSTLLRSFVVILMIPRIIFERQLRLLNPLLGIIDNENPAVEKGYALTTGNMHYKSYNKVQLFTFLLGYSQLN